MKILWNGDLIVKTKSKAIALDPHKKITDCDLTLISHAHSDHTAGFSNSRNIISTKQTYEIYQARTNNTVKNRIELNYGESYEESDVQITSYDSGHVLGSSQFKISNKKESILFTSDINCVNSSTLTAAEPIEADILIIESTYGKPQYVFPSREEINLELVEWVLSQINQQKLPVFKTYSFGKSQEIISIINKYLKIPVVVDDTISKINRIYNKSNIPLKFFNMNDSESQNLIYEKKCALIVSSKNNIPFTLTELDMSLGFASGWALKFKPRNYSMSFPLSSHADYYQLLDYIKKCQPKKVYTIHGYSKELAKSINTILGIPASPIVNVNQKMINEFLN